MSRYDYLKSREIDQNDYPFYAIIMAAMRRADDINLYLLRTVFPAVYDELYNRYNAPGGFLKRRCECYQHSVGSAGGAWEGCPVHGSKLLEGEQKEEC